MSDPAYTEAEARSPSYWRGRAEACLEMADLCGSSAAAARHRAKAHFYERIALGLEREAVDPEALRTTGE